MISFISLKEVPYYSLVELFCCCLCTYKGNMYTCKEIPHSTCTYGGSGSGVIVDGGLPLAMDERRPLQLHPQLSLRAQRKRKGRNLTLTLTPNEGLPYSTWPANFLQTANSR